MREWNADVYHLVSNPQVDWGTAVLDRLPLEGDELILDVGCGTGRLTEKLLARLPRGRLVAVDLSRQMLNRARAHLAPARSTRVAFVQADASALPFAACADAVFSTATFHWIRDHGALFRSLYDALAGGGQLVAQCGGGPNIERLHRRILTLVLDPQFARHFEGWSEPWEFADAHTTARRLEAAGFAEVATDVKPAPVVLPDADSFASFVAHVICRAHLDRLPDNPTRTAFVAALTAQAARDDPPYVLDYWRLNLRARKPAA